MKTKTWILILGAVFLVLAAAAAVQHLGAKPAAAAQVYVDGALREPLDLSRDRVLRVETDYGWNEITVRDGRVCVTAASCRDGDCIRCGAKHSGAPIVCLPNRLSIRFTDDGGLDGVAR